MLKNNIKKSFFLENVLNYLAVFIVFSGAFVFNSNSFFEIRIAYFIMGLMIFAWLPIIKDVVFNKVFFIPFSFLVFFSVYNVFLGFDTFNLLTKQVLGICINAVWFYMLIRINNYDIKKLFRIYLNIAFIVALIGIIQAASYFLRFSPGYDYSTFLPFWMLHPTANFIRVNSIFPEPAGFCISMIPALFASVYSLIDKKNRILSGIKSILIITAFILSFSSTGYFGLIVTLFIILIHSSKVRYILAILVFGALFSYLVFQNSIEFRKRVVDSVNVITSKSSLEEANFSTFALFSNALVAYDSFKTKPLIGSGLGSYELNYEKYVGKTVRVEDMKVGVNKQDAASLFLRLLSETGILGVSLFLFFIIKYRVKRKNAYCSELWVINNAIFVFFVIRLLRVGHYFTDGFFLFFWLYYLSSIESMEISPNL